METFHFECRELPYGAEPVQESELVVGGTYFAITYVDTDLLIPDMETLVFLGKNLEADDERVLYFQDVYAHQNGRNYRNREEREELGIQVYSQGSINHIFEYERALERLMVCSLRRRASHADREKNGSSPRH